jgi:hypothetical protein
VCQAPPILKRRRRTPLSPDKVQRNAVATDTRLPVAAGGTWRGRSVTRMASSRAHQGSVGDEFVRGMSLWRLPLSRDRTPDGAGDASLGLRVGVFALHHHGHMPKAMRPGTV